MAQYDPARRRKGVRKPREAGRWIYLPAAELAKARFAPDDQVFYRATVDGRRNRALVDLYREP